MMYIDVWYIRCICVCYMKYMIHIIFSTISFRNVTGPVWTPCGYVTRAPSPRGEGVGGACSRRKPKERGPGGAVCQKLCHLRLGFF